METDFSPLLQLGVEGLFYILLGAYTIYGLFLSYHWFTYGSNKQISLIALATYLVGGAILFLTFAYSLSIL